jgi:PAS domain S-box-containing protein
MIATQPTPVEKPMARAPLTESSAPTRQPVDVREGELASRWLAAIVESSDDAIISKDLNGVITSWNAGAHRIFGYTADEIIGQPVTRLIPPDRQGEEPTILARICAGQRIDHYETVRVRKDGTLLDISLTVSPIRDREGRLIGASKIARDITARRRAEQQQKALYELSAGVNRAVALTQIYELAVEAICRCQRADRSAILLFDADHVMRFKAWRGLSESYRRAVEGHSPWKPDDPNPQPIWIDDIATAPIDEALRAVVEREGIRSLAFVPMTYEGRLLGKFMVYYDAHHVFTEVELQPVTIVASQVAFAIERQRSTDSLDALVNERTASLRQAIEQMEEFSYTVSHDLRAPARAMCGYAEALLQDYAQQLDPEGVAMLARIQHNSGRMDRLIADLLTYTRISRRELRFERVAMEKLLHDVVQQYPEMQSLRATIDICPPFPDVMAHEPSLLQVVSNLLGNAVKFVAPGVRPVVRVYSESVQDRVRLWFVDNGIGIKPEYQSRIFRMFERVHPHTAYDGTGVGLAIVRKALDRMNGRVGVESDGVSGSKFWVELPAAPPAET